jgi:phosphomevalonate kinase
MAGRFFARAPGKVMLAGEYAVLDGAPSLVMAVDRHARAVADDASALGESDGWLTPELDAALTVAREDALVSPSISARVQPGTLFDGARKLGLGSSAAMCVAGLVAAVRASGLDPSEPGVRSRVTRAALSGHRAAQGGGSGLDVLASALGGVFCTSIRDGQPAQIEPLRFPTGAHWRVLWTGDPVSTREFVARVRELAQRDNESYRALIDRVRLEAERFRDALRSEEVSALVEAVRAAGEAMDSLGQRAGIPIVTDAMRALFARANALGCAVKPSGAGGGDIVFAVSANAEAMVSLVQDCPSLGVTALDLSVDLQGAIIVADPR